ncbi:MAG: 3-phosphoshikimate 1-carboxyvinyltransferase [Candidatus Gastranaerophilales bacterium]|nr:3-phosphoshikimate 1-carboxyvinyltransferase [Candidatus Gastranaerophilales bacterium]MCM1072505.1 3-phosphoshikimate 1-carboxyvinyltransferase [Bacteroides sp.]
MIKTVSFSKPLKGEITIPADKSISHRAVMFSALANGKSLIRNFSNGADCHSTLNLFKQLGINSEFTDSKTILIEGGKLKGSNPIPLACNNSGTTMRLVSGILAGQNFDSVLTGDVSLSKRPMKRIIEPLTLMGADITSVDGHAPITIRGQKLHGIEYNSPIASAQVKSAILLAGLNAEGKTTVKEPYPSRDHTELLLKYLGANIDGTTIYPSELTAKDIDIVGDISSAAFFIAAGLIVKGSDFVIKNVGINPTRTGILDIVQRMGGAVNIFNEREVSGEPCADIRVQYTESLKSCTIEGADIPKLIDELPVIAVLASQADGETIIKDAGDLRNKESDRISCLVKELKKIGVDIEEHLDGFVVRKSELKGNAELECCHDHRLAMSFYIAGLICKQAIAINGFEWTKISFPEFEELINSLYN